MLEIKDISKAYEGLPVIQNCSLRVGEQEIVALTGPSGCGKTTLLNLIAKTLSPDEGEMICQAGRISYMFQTSRLLPWRTVYENIQLVNQEAEKGEIMQLIKAVGLDGFEDYYPGQLSGGMARRCALARAFHYQGDLLLMDEPFQGLDYGLRMDMLQMTLQIWKRKRPSILFVTHELDEALTIASRILVLSGRPTRVLKEFSLPKENGRDCTDPCLSPLRRQIYTLLKGGGTVS